MREVKGSHGGAGGASGGLRAAGGLKVGTRSVDLGDLLLRREKGRPKRPQRERRNCALRPIRGRLVSVIKIMEEAPGLGCIAGESYFTSSVSLYHVLRREQVHMSKSIHSNLSKDGCQPCGCLHPDVGTAAKEAVSHIFL